MRTVSRLSPHGEGFRREPKTHTTAVKERLENLGADSDLGLQPFCLRFSTPSSQLKITSSYPQTHSSSFKHPTTTMSTQKYNKSIRHWIIMIIIIYGMRTHFILLYYIYFVSLCESSQFIHNTNSVVSHTESERDSRSVNGWCSRPSPTHAMNWSMMNSHELGAEIRWWNIHSIYVFHCMIMNELNEEDRQSSMYVTNYVDLIEMIDNKNKRGQEVHVMTLNILYNIWLQSRKDGMLAWIKLIPSINNNKKTQGMDWIACLLWVREIHHFYTYYLPPRQLGTHHPLHEYPVHQPCL